MARAPRPPLPSPTTPCGACAKRFDIAKSNYIKIAAYPMPKGGGRRTVASIFPAVDEIVCSWDCATFIINRESEADVNQIFDTLAPEPSKEY